MLASDAVRDEDDLPVLRCVSFHAYDCMLSSSDVALGLERRRGFDTPRGTSPDRFTLPSERKARRKSAIRCATGSVGGPRAVQQRRRLWYSPPSNGR